MPCTAPTRMAEGRKYRLRGAGRPAGGCRATGQSREAWLPGSGCPVGRDMLDFLTRKCARPSAAP